NCHGSGNLQSVRGLLNLTKSFSPNCVFLSETRLSNQEMEAICIKTGFKNCFTVNADGRRRGLALLWNEELDLSIQSFSTSHIDLVIKLIGRDGYWRLTGIYGKSETHIRHETWSLLCSLARHYDNPWLFAGDFNEILVVVEKEGGSARDGR
ncbi:Exo_endo_phos domain-containing protein, partial [Cephalotus follicularis]